jgi:hypothetical protein
MIILTVFRSPRLSITILGAKLGKQMIACNVQLGIISIKMVFAVKSTHNVVSLIVQLESAKTVIKDILSMMENAPYQLNCKLRILDVNPGLELNV